jgi:glycosyltransferase involved in cell wall biosynthesis
MLPVLNVLRARVPVVQTVYDWLPLEIPYYAKLKWGFRAHWTIAQPLLRRATTFTVNSDFIKQYVRGRWPSAPVHVVPNAVSEAARWLSVPPAPKSGPFTFLYWGELYEKKGPLILVEAARRLREQNPSLMFRVWMGGTGPQENVVREAIRVNALADRVEILGPIPQEELYKRIAAAHAVVMPSAYEGFGIAILEAMTAGRAVITTNVGGATEIISAAEQGLLVPRTPEAYASAMASLAFNPDRATAIGEAARTRSRDFDWSTCANRFVDVFNEACAQRGNAA